MKSFTANNRKIKKLAKHYNLPYTHVVGFNLPAGRTCPGAEDCKAWTDPITGKLSCGKKAKFRCYMANMECLSKGLRNQGHRNFEALKEAKSADKMTEWLLMQLNLDFPKAQYIRLHPGGDFFNQSYFDAWMMVAMSRPELQIYGYTKSIPFWTKRSRDIPENLKLVASMGGKYDDLAIEWDFRQCIVVNSPHDHLKTFETDAESEIFILEDTRSFAILMHGNQPSFSKSYNWEENYDNSIR